jgi:glutathione S-transferase
VNAFTDSLRTALTILLDEVDPYKKPADLLEVSPKGLVPGLKLHTYTPPRGLNESTVILEYFEEYVDSLSRDST